MDRPDRNRPRNAGYNTQNQYYQQQQRHQYNNYQNYQNYDDDEDDNDYFEKKPSIWGRIIRTVIVLSCIGVLVYCGIYLYNTVSQTRLSGKVVSEVFDESDDGKTYLKLNWEALKETYPDLVGWIYIPHTDVNYPLVQSPSDSDYYLKHGPQKEENEMGAIFVASEQKPDFTEDNTMIYGHSILYYGGMLTGLNRFQDDTHFIQNPYLYILTPKSTYRGLIRDFAKTKDGTQYYVTNTNGWANQNVAQWQLDNAMQTRPEIDLPKGSNLVTLSTCDLAEGGAYTKTRFVIQAKLEYYMEDVEYVDDTGQEFMRKMGNFLSESVNSFDQGKGDDSETQESLE